MNRPDWYVAAAKSPVARGMLLTLSIALMLSGCHRKSADDYIAAGDSAVQAQKLDEAEGDYKQAGDLAPNDPHPHLALGKLYLMEHKASAAQSEFMRVLELDPKNAEAHVALGNLYTDQAQFPMAESQYRAAITLDSSRSEYHALLGATLAKEGRPADAETELRTAIGFDPKNAQAHFQLANLLSTLPNRQNDTKAEYDQARQLDPKMVPPAPITPPSVTGEGAAAGAPSTAKIKPVQPPRLFLLTHDSPVYTSPDAGSAVVGNVRHRKYVRVIGITGAWLQVRLKNGTVGFVPSSAAE
jgi:tetratricopeptide (TPR) repeat protein